MDASVWTPDKKDQVAELLRQGHSASHIARQFPDATRNAIIGLVHRDKTLMAVGFARSIGRQTQTPRKSQP